MNFLKEFRFNEVLVMCYRLLLAFFFFQVARFLFWFYNRDDIRIDTVSEYLKIAYHGTAFDTTAILYTNALFIVLSLLPLTVNTKKTYQKMLFWVYFVLNGIAYSLNFIDLIYFRFSRARLTRAAFDVVENEHNLTKVFAASIVQHPLVLFWFIGLMTLWIYLYKRIQVKEKLPVHRVGYYMTAVVCLCVAALLAVGGIRGDFRHSTRPINMIDAAKHVQRSEQANVVLNSTFSFLRTIDFKGIREVHLVNDVFVKKNISSYKHYHRDISQKPNIVLFIVESFGREYSGAFNPGTKDYESFTPFIDSLAQHSLIFPNTFANGRQSIHGMSSILAGIPSFTDAFTGSPYANQNIQSLVSVAKEMGYDTSFYHGAPNGSMGYQGFAGILGIRNYYGMKEYNNDKDFDGMWAIWDEPFLQYFAKNVGGKQPFFTTVFTASSHHPFKIPEKYEGKFKKGHVEMHQPIQYADYALKKYFETAARQPWFRNTIFIITADHPNQSYYEKYSKGLNRFAVPILLYTQNAHYQLKGINNAPAQQIDIYPTVVDLVGYNKRFRSWGRSLLRPEDTPPVIVNSDGVTHYFTVGNYVYTFNGKEVIGVYDKTDIPLEHNLINKLKTQEIEYGKNVVKGWFQDYMNRIVNRQLN